jgi:hypothetical protein
VFHSIAGRAQVSGPDVILAHRLPKYSVASSEYLLPTEAAFDLTGRYLPDGFVAHEDRGFGTVNARVGLLDEQMLAAREAVYAMDREQLDANVEAYVEEVSGDGMRRSASDGRRRSPRTGERALDRPSVRRHDRSARR